MPDSVLVLEERAQNAPLLDSHERRVRWFELGLVLLVAFALPLMRSISVLTSRQLEPGGRSDIAWLAGTVQELTALAVLGYVLFRRGTRWRNLGIRWAFRDLWRGVFLAFAAYATYAVGALVVAVVHHAITGVRVHEPDARQFFGLAGLVAVPYFLLSPVFEEVIVRVFLMREVRELTGSSALAVVASTLLQSSYHLYYGWAGACSVAFIFLTFSIYFARTQRAMPLIVAHELFDIVGVVRIWFF